MGGVAAVQLVHSFKSRSATDERSTNLDEQEVRVAAEFWSRNNHSIHRQGGPWVWVAVLLLPLAIHAAAAGTADGGSLQEHEDRAAAGAGGDACAAGCTEAGWAAFSLSTHPLITPQGPVEAAPRAEGGKRAGREARRDQERKKVDEGAPLESQQCCATHPRKCEGMIAVRGKQV